MTNSPAYSPNYLRCDDPVVRNQWHAITAIDVQDTSFQGTDGRNRVPIPTTLLGEPICYRLGDGTPEAWAGEGIDGRPLRCRTDFGYLWVSLSHQPVPMFELPEADEADRRTLNAISVGIATSAPRAVENFLDLAHFPFVHPATLGAEPHTEVPDYEVQWIDGDIWAVDCRFYQPQAAAASSAGVMADYRYRVPHPYAAILYKTSPGVEDRWDAIAIFIHPIDEERITAHLFLSLIDDVTADETLRAFQSTIIGQDKIILENQLPRRLPLDPRAETPIRADLTSITYRRWLADLGVTYGVLPPGAKV